MHATIREKRILNLLAETGFVSFKKLESDIQASPATLRRDLERLAGEGKLERVRGGAERVGGSVAIKTELSLVGVPFQENINIRKTEKQAIGRAAAAFCATGEGIMIDGGTTTFNMCPYIADLKLQVLTNSLHIVTALLPLKGTRVLVPAGTVFPEQNIILSPHEDEGFPRFHAPRLFMGAAAIGPKGPMQADVLLVASQRRLLERAEESILLVDSSKFSRSSGMVVCGLSELDMIITDWDLADKDAAMIERAGVKLIIAEPD